MGDLWAYSTRFASEMYRIDLIFTGRSFVCRRIQAPSTADKRGDLKGSTQHPLKPTQNVDF